MPTTVTSGWSPNSRIAGESTAKTRMPAVSASETVSGK
ncbi:hypothetical protein BC477_14440 [Clavibacter michiganensis subsp. michiganensis]|uniref:Uncharacterized protein n=1 Tax=Clavibacter michiganensis subsp. michiganensis TaxID=33013 RepID=A0A251XEN8_CLAMM|nr:hypothetical protein BC477_14440 [Clavibacter michiganensis subsp. michiganensis]OUE00711.1 hypothetical protein CMMCAS07_16610 [Clavibacter michiganensis subsp. michiganensis]